MDDGSINPYEGDLIDQPVRAVAVGPTPGGSPRPRLWPTLVVCLILLPVVLVVSGIAIVIAMAACGVFRPGITQTEINAWLTDFIPTPIGLLVFIVPGQVVFLAAAIAPAILSRQSFSARLGLLTSKYPWWFYVLVVLATPVVGLIGSVPVLYLAGEPSEHLKMMYSAITTAGSTSPILVFVLICVMPAIAEETLFRGYVLQRLLLRWQPLSAILASSAFFAIVHGDPIHAAAVFPLGLWLGFITWQTGSIWPAIACHFANNTLSFVETLVGDPLDTEMTFDALTTTTIAISSAALLGSLALLLTHRLNTKAESLSAAAEFVDDV